MSMLARCSGRRVSMDCRRLRAVLLGICSQQLGSASKGRQLYLHHGRTALLSMTLETEKFMPS